MTLLYTFSFMGLCYFFRFRRLNLASSVAIASVYYLYSSTVNKIGYKLIVDS